MTNWTSDELGRIGKAEELEIAGRQADGALRKSVTIWVVRLGDELYVRSYKGRGSGWFRGTQLSKQGHVQAGGVDKDVAFFEETDPGLNYKIDAAYRVKYRRYEASIVDSILTPEAHAATIRLVPAQAFL
jgi:hypothetical protein